MHSLKIPFVCQLNIYQDINKLNLILFILFAVLPAAILQDRFFSINRPNYVNYANIGSLIGHEITHGFDDQGRQYNFKGELVNWWLPETGKRFVENTKCIIEQYGNYTDLNTNLTVITLAINLDV